MGKFNRAKIYREPVEVPAVGFLNAGTRASGLTHEGAPGFAYDSKSELYLLAVTSFFSGDTFYEKDKSRLERFIRLVRTVAVSDPNWMRRFVPWLRREAHMRTAPMVAALEAADAMVAAKIPGSRDMVAHTLMRGDEPAEAVAYWLSTHGRRMPKPIKRGIADAAQQTFNQHTFLKWNSSRSSVSMADVVELCHVKPTDITQSRLFKYVLDKAHGRDSEDVHSSLSMITANRNIRKLAEKNPYVLMDTGFLERSGFTWEDGQSLLGTLVPEAERTDMKRTLWEKIIPTMGYMALLRNLRNFSVAGISREAQEYVISRLTDPDAVRRSRQFPFRFLSAQEATSAWTVWTHALETALELSLSNIPELPGRTLILVDESGSMRDQISRDSSRKRIDVAGLFGAALAVRNGTRATLAAFNSSARIIQVPAHASVLPLSRQFHATGGTMTQSAVRQTFNHHDRVIIITDEQGQDGDPGAVLPAQVPLYTWNLAGYGYSNTAGTERRFTFGGLTDQSFKLIPLLEQGPYSQGWPF